MQANKAGAHVVVGVLSDKKNQRKGEPITNAVLGFIHEFGTEDGHVPERSFIRSTIDSNRAKYAAFIRRLARLVLLGQLSEADALNMIGLKVQGDVVRTINAGIPPPLAQSTIRSKTVNGKAGTTPLINTGQLKSAITYEVRRAGPTDPHAQKTSAGSKSVASAVRRSGGNSTRRAPARDATGRFVKRS